MKYLRIMAMAIFVAGMLMLAVSSRAGRYYLVSLNYEPYSYSRNGTYTGYDVEILKECFRRMGDDLEIDLVPWKRALSMGMTGNSDGVFGIFKLPERAEKMFFSDPVRAEEISFFVREDSTLVFDGDLNQLKNSTFGTVSGYSYGDEVDSFLKNAIPKSHVEVGVSPEMNLVKLIKGRFDIYIGDTLSTLSSIHKMGLEGLIRRLKPSINTSDVHVAFSRKLKLGRVRDRFNDALESMRLDGTLERIKMKYFHEQSKDKKVNAVE